MKLSEVCLNIVDCPHSTVPDEGSGYALVRTPNIGKGRFNLESVHRISEKSYKKRCSRITPTTNDLILAREAPAGNVAIIKKGIEPLALGQRTVLIRPNPEKVNPDYLVYYLLSPKQQYELLGRATGATVAHVNMSVINNLPISIPSLETQQKIASILSAYDDLIENNRKQIKLLEEAAQRLYKEWFVDFRFPGYENVAIVDGVPDGWRKGTLGEIGEFKRGKTITKTQAGKGNIPVVAGGIEPAYYTDKSNTSAPVITISASGNAGFVKIYFSQIWASDCSFLDVENNEKLYYIYSFLKANQTYIYSLQKGACQQHVYAKDINAIELIIPNMNIICDYVNTITPYFEKIEALQKQIQLLQQARDKLLPRLMSGEMEV